MVQGVMAAVAGGPVLVVAVMANIDTHIIALVTALLLIVGLQIAVIPVQRTLLGRALAAVAVAVAGRGIRAPLA